MKKLSFAIAAVLLAIGIADLIRWFIITDKDLSFAEMKIAYSNPLPRFLQQPMASTLALVCLYMLAAFLFLYTTRQKSFRVPALAGVVLCSILGFWQIFSLM